MSGAALPSLPDPDRVGASLYAHLDTRGTRPVRAIQRISARNLTDEDAYSHDYVVSPSRAGDSSFWRFSIPRAPREYGAEITFNF